MQIHKTALPNVIVIEPKVFHDNRGLFYESFQEKRYAENGLDVPFVQDNVSRSEKNVIRGLHYQLEHPQGKLIYVIHGSIIDVIADIRVGSPTFGQSIMIEISEHNRLQVYIPPGFAHGFVVLSDRADVIYKCTDFYYPQAEYGIVWNDPTLNIAWPVEHPILSPKDAAYPFLQDISSSQLPQSL